METEKAQILEIKQGDELKGIVYHDFKTRNQVFYKVSKMDQDEIKDLLNNKTHETK